MSSLVQAYRQLTERLGWKRNVHCAKKISSPDSILCFSMMEFVTRLFYALCKFTLNLMVTNWQVRVGTLIDNWLIGSFQLEKDPHQLLTPYACVAVFSDCLRWLRISTFQERSRNFPEPAVQTSHYGENVSDCVSDSYKPQIGNVIMFLIVFPFISYKLAMP